jgi:hypothetical protein
MIMAIGAGRCTPQRIAAVTEPSPGSAVVGGILYRR